MDVALESEAVTLDPHATTAAITRSFRIGLRHPLALMTRPLGEDLASAP